MTRRLMTASTTCTSCNDNNRTRQIAYLAFNFISTLLLTLINKAVFSRIDFGFPAALCNVHFVITWLGVKCLRRYKVFEPLEKPQIEIIDKNFLVMVFVLGTVTPLNNSSLKLNSVGFYQIFKLLLTPVIVVLEYFLNGKVLSGKRGICLAFVCGFVLISSQADYEFNMWGTVCATIWVPLAALYKVQWSRLLVQYNNCSTLALMHMILPYAIVVQALISPLVDPPGLYQYLQLECTPQAALLIAVSGLAAFLVNYSGFLVMGHLGALAHVLLGQLKTSCIMVAASFFFGSRYSPMQIAGAAGAVASIVAYTHITVEEKKNVVKLVKGEEEGSDDDNALNLDELARAQERLKDDNNATNVEEGKVIRAKLKNAKELPIHSPE